MRERKEPRRIEDPKDLHGKRLEIRFGSDVRNSHVYVDGEEIACMAATVSVDGRDFGRGTEVELTMMPPTSGEPIVVKGTLTVDGEAEEDEGE